MPIRLGIISFSCLVLAGCNPNNTEIKTHKLTQLQVNRQVEILPTNLSFEQEERRNRKELYTNSDQPNSNIDYPQDELLNNNSPGGNNQKFAPNNYLAQKVSIGKTRETANYMTLTPSGRTNDLGNPLFELRIYANNQLLGSFLTVSGRRHTQHRDRHRSGTEAPLPNGTYTVARSYTRGNIPEAGERFLPITPLFPTGRTALGIHVDPSFNQHNGEDGTSGCIGLTSIRDLDQLLNYVYTYHPQYINVQI